MDPAKEAAPDAVPEAEAATKSEATPEAPPSHYRLLSSQQQCALFLSEAGKRFGRDVEATLGNLEVTLGSRSHSQLLENDLRFFITNCYIVI